MSYLQSAIGEPALPEVGNFIRQYFKILKRKRGESMLLFCVRHREEYECMCRALARILRKQGEPSRLGSRGTTGYGVSEGPGSVRGDDLEGLRPPDADQVPDTPIAWQVQQWNHDGWYTHYDSSWGGWYQRDWQVRPWNSSGTQSDHWHRPQGVASEIEDDESMIEVHDRSPAGRSSRMAPARKSRIGWPRTLCDTGRDQGKILLEVSGERTSKPLER